VIPYSRERKNEQYSKSVYKRRPHEDLIIEKLVSKFNLKGSILDIGCGLGFDDNSFKNFGLRPIGIDLSNVGIKRARDAFKDLEWITCDARRYPFRLEIFDVLFSKDLSIFNTIDNASCQNFIKTSLNFLKSGCLFIIVYSSNLRGEVSPTSSWINHSLEDAQSWIDGLRKRARVFFVFIDFIKDKVPIFNRFITLLSIFLNKLFKRRGLIFLVIEK